MKYTITNINYDTDGEIIDLPKMIIVDVPSDILDEDIEDYLSDEISNISGFCHKGFSIVELD